MRQRYGLAFLLATLVVGTVVALTAVQRQKAAPGTPPSSTQPALSIDQRIRQMSVEEKVGQLFLVGFPGQLMGYEAQTLVEEYHVGGVILFGRNIDSPVQVAVLTNQLQKAATTNGAGIPLLIATDQEGGIVQRLAGATNFPGNMALGAVGSEELARQQGEITARELRAVGINVDFAPVVDVNNNPDNPVIGLRSLGSDPQQVARLGTALVQGLQAGGVLATAKHFPGHGDTSMDSHISLPTVPYDRAHLDRVELVPFAAAIKAGVGGIMTAHITFPAVDPTPGLPATLSPKVLQGLLRQELGFKGLIFTDALEMGAIVQTWGIGEAAVKAIQAGADQVLIAWPRDWQDEITAIQRVVAAVRAGEITTSRLDESVRRILQAKEQLGLFRSSQVDPQAVAKQVATPTSQAVGLQIARRSITVVRNQAHVLPLKPGYTGKIVVIAPQDAALTQVEELGSSSSTLGKALRSGAKNVVEYLYPVSGRSSIDVAAATRLARSADLVVVGTYRATQSSAQVDLVRSLLELDKPTVVVALREPYDILRFPEVKTYVATYGYTPVSLQALGDVLFGRVKPAGKLPVEIPGIAPLGTGLTW
ncbi:MAG: beta-N-acetylhexosaminidase [Limnochordaceae bacterium]|nr:beta-N-acetylhexosaminidase [Limnochordaceae bacterium]